MKFPIDAPKARVLKALYKMGFRLVREHSHISLFNDATQTSMTIPNHYYIKASTLQTSLKDSNVARNDFLTVYYKV